MSKFHKTRDYNLQIKTTRDFADYFKKIASAEDLKLGQFLEKIFNQYMKE